MITKCVTTTTHSIGNGGDDRLDWNDFFQSLEAIFCKVEQAMISLRGSGVDQFFGGLTPTLPPLMT